MNVGVTGHRYQPDNAWAIAHAKLMSMEDTPFRSDMTLYHGACRGWDTTCAKVAAYLGWRVIAIRPADHKDVDLSSLAISDEIIDAPPGTSQYNNDYRVRNTLLVSMVDELVAFWDGRARSGTAMTINIAKKLEKPVTIVDVVEAERAFK